MNYNRDKIKINLKENMIWNESLLLSAVANNYTTSNNTLKNNKARERWHPI